MERNDTRKSLARNKKHKGKISIFYSFNRKYYEFIMTRTSYIEYYLSFHFIYENGYFRITIFKRK